MLSDVELDLIVGGNCGLPDTALDKAVCEVNDIGVQKIAFVLSLLP